MRSPALRIGTASMVVIGFWYALAGSAWSAEVNDKEGGGKVQDFQIDDIQGKVHKLADFKGKVLIIQHMSPGCPTCNQQIVATGELRKKYGKENLKAIAFIYDGTFNDDQDRERNRDKIKGIVEKGAAAEGGQIPKMDYDAYCVWSFKVYSRQIHAPFKKEPLLTCIIDKEGNFVYRKTDDFTSMEDMDKYVSKMLQPVEKEQKEQEQEPAAEAKPEWRQCTPNGGVPGTP